MANRRMLSLKIIDTDLFLEMPVSARLLYYDLVMRADDDGFVSSPKKIQKITGCSDDDFKLLTAKQFIIPFENGICVITHWRIHNYIRSDRYTETIYKDEKQQLIEENGVYNVSKIGVLEECHTIGIPSVIPTGYTGKVRVVKDSINIYSANAEQFAQHIWSLYPKKKGKKIAIERIKDLLADYKVEELERCVYRYSEEVQDKESEFMLNGSTFFKDRFIDYLDENFVQTEQNNVKVNGFNNFKPRQYDYDDLEMRLLGWDK